MGRAVAVDLPVVFLLTWVHADAGMHADAEEIACFLRHPPWHEIALLACENKNPLCFEIFANSPARPIVAARMPRKLNRPRYALPNPATICHCAF